MMYYSKKDILLKCGCILCLRLIFVVFYLVTAVHIFEFKLVTNCQHLTNNEKWEMVYAATVSNVFDQICMFSLQS